MDRPGALANLSKGKSIYEAAGLTDTFNWMVSCLGSLSAEGALLEGLDHGMPKLKVKLAGGVGVKVEESNGTWTISLDESSEDEGADNDKGATSTSSSGSDNPVNPGSKVNPPNTPASGGGGTSGTGGGGAAGGGWPGGVGGGTGGSTGGGGGGAETGGSGSVDSSDGDSGSQCNHWSEEYVNDWTRVEFEEFWMGDNCETLNGW